MTESSSAARTEPIRLQYLIPAQYQSWCRKVDDPNWVHHRYRDAKDNAMASAIRELRDSRAQVETLTEERDSANRRLGRQIQDTQDRIAALQQQVSALRDRCEELEAKLARKS